MNYTPYSELFADLLEAAGPHPDVLALRSRWRAQVLPTLRGTVLDVGAGEGSILGYLSLASRTTLLEPHRRSATRLERLTATRPHTHVLCAPAERIPIPDASVDAVVCCVSLCSVADQDRALAELARVLRPGGRLVAFEHVAAPKGTWLRRGQRAIAPVSRWVDRGCDPARETEAALRRSSLDLLALAHADATAVWGLRIPHLLATLARPSSPPAEAAAASSTTLTSRGTGPPRR